MLINIHYNYVDNLAINFDSIYAILQFIIKHLDFKFTEVEAFIKDNTKELSSEKWLCPLSGKKFRGPEFVRKHICNKHADKVNEVKAEVTMTPKIRRIALAVGFK